MAVQQRRKTRSKRDKRRTHQSLSNVALSIDHETGEMHRRHHMTEDGYYRGVQVIPEQEEE